MSERPATAGGTAPWDPTGSTAPKQRLPGRAKHESRVVRLLRAAGLVKGGPADRHLEMRAAHVLHDAAWHCYTHVRPSRARLRSLRQFMLAGMEANGRSRGDWVDCFDHRELQRMWEPPGAQLYDAASTFLGGELFAFATDDAAPAHVRLAGTVACIVGSIFDRNGQSRALSDGFSRILPQDDDQEALLALAATVRAREFGEDPARSLAEARRLLARAEREAAAPPAPPATGAASPPPAAPAANRRTGRPSTNNACEDRVAKVLKGSRGRWWTYEELRLHPDLRGIGSMTSAMSRARKQFEGLIGSKVDPENYVRFAWQGSR